MNGISQAFFEALKTLGIKGKLGSTKRTLGQRKDGSESWETVYQLPVLRLADLLALEYFKEFERRPGLVAHLAAQKGTS